MSVHSRGDAMPNVGGLQTIESEPLRIAAANLLLRTPPDDPPEFRIRLEEDLISVGVAVEDIKGGADPVVSDHDPELIARVRDDLVRQRGERGGVWAITELAALEYLAGLSAPTPGPNAQGDLLGPDGFELVVEMAHDLRSPLSSILFLSETLRRGQSGETTPLQHKQLGLIYSAAFRLATVVNDVMEIAKDRGTLRDESEQPFSLVETVNSVIELVAPIAEEKGLSLVTDLGDLDYVRGFPISTTRVLLNLTTNALHHTTDGGVDVAVWRYDRSTLEFAVSDTGEGISDAARSTLFQPFRRRGDGSRMMFSGTGLGLSIARALVDAMGGQLGYDSEPGVGTRFWFRVPVGHP